MRTLSGANAYATIKPRNNNISQPHHLYIRTLSLD